MFERYDEKEEKGKKRERICSKNLFFFWAAFSGFDESMLKKVFWVKAAGNIRKGLELFIMINFEENFGEKKKWRRLQACRHKQHLACGIDE